MRVDPATVLEISRLEKMPEVGTVNVLLSKYWERLWANDLLLRNAALFHSLRPTRVGPLTLAAMDDGT